MKRSWQPVFLLCVSVFFWTAVCNWLPSAEKGTAPPTRTAADGGEVILLDDDFGKLEPGLFSAPVGAHTEYHFLPEAAPRGGWTVACFSSDGSQRAWHVQQEGDRRVMAQTFDTSQRKFHPLLVAGDPLWTDYRLQVRFAPQDEGASNGVVFRYRNNRCYYSNYQATVSLPGWSQ